MPESETESESSGSGSHRSSYSSESYSDDKTERQPKKKDAQQNKSQSKPPPSQLGSQRNHSRTSSVGHQGGNVSNNATRRMLSAGRLKINELRNKVSELTVQLANVQVENKQLLRQQRQQDRLLAKYDHQENEAPVIVQRVNEESNALRVQLRRVRDRYETKCEKLRVTSDELDRTQRLLKKMKSLVDDKKLAERDELSRKLAKAQQDIEAKDVTIRDLYKHVENLQKNHRHEIGIERARHRETQQTLERMQELDAKLQVQLKEKEKEIGVRNIYAMRQNKPPHHLDTSVHSTPVSSSEGRRLPQKPKLRSIRPLQPVAADNYTARRLAKKETSRSESEPSEELTKSRSSVELSRQLEEEQQMLAKLEAEQKEEARLNEEHEKRERERREFERQKRELERERERAERERRELEEQRRRAREEAERTTSAEEQERQRQKELLLARMKAIDEGTVNSSDITESSSLMMNGPAPIKRTAADDDVHGAVFGEYRPSFLAGTTTSSAKTKKTLSTRRRDPAASRPQNNLLIFDDDDDFTKPSNAVKPESPDLSFLSGQPSNGDMGGGDKNSKHLLPRRPRQQATSMNGLVTDLSDDIEEVIL